MMAQDEKPDRASREEMAEDEGRGGGARTRGGGSSFRALVVCFLVSLVVSFGVVSIWAMPNLVTKEDFTKNLQGVVADVGAVKGSIGDLGSIKSDLASLKGAVASLGTLPGQIAQVNKDLANVASKIEASGTKAEIAGVNTQVADLQKSSDKATVSISDVSKNITELRDEIAKIVNGTTTIAGVTYSHSAPASGAPGTVTASVVADIFTGNQMMSYGAIPASSSATQQFTFQIANNTSKTANSIQLAIALQLFDANGNVMSGGLPSGAVVTLASPGLNTIWSAPTVIYPYLIGFTNTVTSGVFGSIGALSQPVGTGTYTIAVTVATGTNAISNAFKVYPVVKVVSYS